VKLGRFAKQFKKERRENCADLRKSS